ncbi:ATP-binding protein [Halovibrio salipaludis]|nr:sensor histidine kinase [Halovibrio salipaludis]
MRRIDPCRSIRGMLLVLLLPAAIGLMGAAWVIHGMLLDRMVSNFVETHLQGDHPETMTSDNVASLNAGQRELHWWTAGVSVLLLALLAAAIWFAIRIALRSVHRLKAALRALQQGERERLDVDAPEEFQSLVDELNRLLESLEHRLDRSRDALANLSHSVKTPIAAVRQVLEDPGRELDADLRAQLARRLSEIDRQLEAEMRRSRFAGAQAGRGACPVTQARDLLWMLGRLYPERDFELDTDLSEDRRWPMEEQDLNELLGNLLDNAGKWAERRVLLSLVETPDWLEIQVADDGQGVPEDQLQRLGTRGLRLDEQAPGHGLGLAIVRDTVSRYGGDVVFSSRMQGGLCVQVRLPSVMAL